MINLHTKTTWPRFALLASSALLLAIFRPGGTASAIPYTFKTFSHNGETLIPMGISRSGIIVGKTLNKTAFIWTPTSYQEVAAPSPYDNVAFMAVNDAGTAIALVEGYQTCTWSNGVFGPFDPANTLYFGLDDEGHKVGDIYGSDNKVHALYDTTQVDVFAATDTRLLGVTDTFQNRILAVGQYTAGGQPQIFEKDSTQANLIPINSPDSNSETFPTGINDFGVIVGYYHPGFTDRGFVRYANGTIDDLLVPGATDTYAYGISYGGTIVGETRDAHGNEAGFTAVRQDGYTIDDVVSTLQFVAGFDNFQGVADPGRQDLDGDGRITLKDAELIMRKVGGLSPNP